VAAAKLNAEQVAENMIQNGLNLVRDVLLGYTDIILAKEKAEIFEEEAKLQEEIATIASARLRAGDISELEESAFLLEAATTKEKSIQLKRDFLLAETKFKTLLGLEPEQILKLTPVSFELQKEFNSTEIIETALIARPELRAAEILIEAAGKKLGWERSKIFNLTAILDANGEGKEGFETGPGIQMELPIFNWNNGKISRAHAEMEYAAKNYLVVKQRIVQDVLDANNRYSAARKSYAIITENIIPTAEKSTLSAEKVYLVGEISYLEFLSFKRQLLNSKLKEAETFAELKKAMAQLRHSIGFKPDYFETDK
jgi:cobalt-zinc-cadmium efflux system outer membrane protein